MLAHPVECICYYVLEPRIQVPSSHLRSQGWGELHELWSGVQEFLCMFLSLITLPCLYHNKMKQKATSNNGD